MLILAKWARIKLLGSQVLTLRRSARRDASRHAEIGMANRSDSTGHELKPDTFVGIHGQDITIIKKPRPDDRAVTDPKPSCAP